jgi:sugar O-acyltransferase (sialic acid O-acetyltransferase NeuD family)
MGKVRYLIILGAGGFGQEIVWAVRNMNAVCPRYEVAGYCDDDPTKKGGVIYGTSILGSAEEVDKSLFQKPGFVCAIGNNLKRALAVDRVLALGWKPVTVIDPSVIIAEGVVVEIGTYVGAGSILSPYAQIGKHVIINHHCSIGHNSVLEDFVQISPGGRVSGGCRIETRALLGSNAVVAPGRIIGRRATLGACSFAMTDVPDDVTAIGTPARVVMKHAREKDQREGAGS